MLGEAVGIDIDLEERESSVGSFSVDIFATEEGTGRKIIWHEATIDAVFGYDTYDADFNPCNWEKYFEWYCEKAIKLREVVKKFAE